MEGETSNNNTIFFSLLMYYLKQMILSVKKYYNFIIYKYKCIQLTLPLHRVMSMM